MFADQREDCRVVSPPYWRGGDHFGRRYYSSEKILPQGKRSSVALQFNIKNLSKAQREVSLSL